MSQRPVSITSIWRGGKTSIRLQKSTTPASRSTASSHPKGMFYFDVTPRLKDARIKSYVQESPSALLVSLINKQGTLRIANSEPLVTILTANFYFLRNHRIRWIRGYGVLQCTGRVVYPGHSLGFCRRKKSSIRWANQDVGYLRKLHRNALGDLLNFTEAARDIQLTPGGLVQASCPVEVAQGRAEPRKSSNRADI